VLGAAPEQITAGMSLPAFADAARELSSRIGSVEDPADIWRTLGEWALSHIANSEPPDGIVRRALCSIAARGGDISTGALAREAHLGVRQLQRRFVYATGYTIKSYARVRRLRTALELRMAGDSSWSMTAATAGFADQAHLAREFVELTGLAPTQSERHLARIRHRNVKP
jgi:AraC-like DNA-binding protein